MNSEPSLNENYPPRRSRLLWAIIILGLVGFFDAAFLTVEHYLGAVPPCSVVNGCETVLTSSYATIGFVPVALFGAIYYAAIFLFALRANHIWLRRLTTIGFLATLYFLYLQFFVIQAICLYCLLSAVVTITIFVLAWRHN